VVYFLRGGIWFLRGKVIWGTVVGLAVLYACLQAGDIQSDTLFHIKIGEWIFHHGVIPRADIFSWTVPGSSWVAHEWLWGLLAYMGYETLGAWGTWLLTSLGVVMYGLSLWGLFEEAVPSARRCNYFYFCAGLAGLHMVRPSPRRRPGILRFGAYIFLLTVRRKTFPPLGLAGNRLGLGQLCTALPPWGYY